MSARIGTAHPEPARWLMRRARSASLWVGLSVGFGLAGGLLLVLQASLLAHIVHGAFIEGLPRTERLPDFLDLLGVIALRGLTAWVREAAGFRASARVREGLRMELMEHIAALGPLHPSGRHTGALASTVLEQVEALHGFFAHYLPQMALAVMIPLAILAFVYPVNWAAGTILLVTAPLIPLFMVLVGMEASAMSQRQFQALARMSAHFLDTLQGLATLKLFDRSRAELEAVVRVSEDYRRRTMSVLRIAFLNSAVLELFGSVAIAAVAVYLGLSFLGRLDFGHYGEPLTLEVGLFILLLAPEFYLPLRELGAHYHARAEAMGAAAEILEVLAVPRPQGPAVPSRLPSAEAIALRLEDAHLAFEHGQRPALSGLSFTVAARERVALVGPSGAGKSTVLNLLLGFLRPDRGRVLVNGVDLATLDPDAWLRHVAWVGQNPLLFYGSIRDNILLGRADAAPAEVERAARAARVWDFAAELPEGLDAPVGERGAGLSGGQAQRVALARAFLKDAPLLLLDEPTAHLDAESERLVLDAIEALARGRTVVMLTHRLASLQHADRVLVLEAGRLVEQGSRDELLALRGLYHRLAVRQRGGEPHA